jgi:DNA-binding FadR family transcriptional regulator
LKSSLAKNLIRWIKDSSVCAGDYLPTEFELMEQLGASRASLREAVKILETQRVLHIDRGKGTRMLPVTEWNVLDPDVWSLATVIGDSVGLIRELAEVRQIVEPRAAYLAAQHRTDSELMQLGTIIKRLGECFHDIPKYNRYDSEFHVTLARSGHNQLLAQLVVGLEEVIAANKAVSDLNPGATERSLAGHRSIYQAVVDQDPERALATMQGHLDEFEHNLVKILTSTATHGRGKSQLIERQGTQ